MLTRRAFAAHAAAALLVRPAFAEKQQLVSMPADFDSNDIKKQQEIAKWFTDANSKIGGSCCSMADGFIQGATYRIWERFSSEHTRFVDHVMLKSVRREGDTYWIEAYDKGAHEYAFLPAPYESLVLKPNPTGYYVAWLWYPDNKFAVRCFAPLSES